MFLLLSNAQVEYPENMFVLSGCNKSTRVQQDIGSTVGNKEAEIEDKKNSKTTSVHESHTENDSGVLNKRQS